MKKIFVSIAMCTAVLLGVNACQKETAETVVPGSGYDGEGWKIDFSATIEPQGQTELKTHLGGDHKNLVYWDNTDKIVLLGVEGTGDGRHKDVLNVESVTPGTETRATFKSPELPNVGVEELACAVYPSDCVDYYNTSLTKNDGGKTGSLDGVISGYVVINFPATQTYANNSFANGANVAVGKEVKTFDEAKKSGNSSISFRNAFGVLELHLKGDFKVGKIKVTGHNGEKLNGKFKVDLDNIDNTAAFTGAVATADRTAGDDVITLDCTGVTGGGVQLDPETATTFDIVVPVNAFAHGFAARVYDAEGEHKFALLTTIKNNEINRSKIKAMPEMTFDGSTPKYIEVEWLESKYTSGKGPYINTQVTANQNTAAELVVKDVGSSTKKSSEYIFGASGTVGKRYFLAVGKIITTPNDKYGYVWHFGDSNAIKSDIECSTESYQGFHTHKLVEKTYYIDNKQFGPSTYADEVNSNELYLFAVNGSSGSDTPTGDFQIKSAKIWQDGMSGPMTRNYLPCYCPSGAKYRKADGTGGTNNAASNTYGMLDLVKDGLYKSLGGSDTPKFKIGDPIY